MRRLAAAAFTTRRVAELEDTVRSHAATLAGYIGHLGRSGEPVDFMAEFARRLPARVTSTVLGVPAIDHEWFRERAEAVTTVVEPQLQAPDHKAADRAALELRSYFADLAGQRRAAPQDDLTSALVRGYDTDQAEGLDPVNIEYFENDGDTTLALQSGRIDATFGPNATSAYKAAVAPQDFKVVGIVNGGWPDTAQIAAATLKGNDLAPAITAAINHAIEDGSYDKVLERWGLTEEAVTESETNPAGLPKS